MKLSKFQAVKMGSEYFTLSRYAESALRDKPPHPFLAADFRRRAEVIKNALAMHGWRLLSDGINVERVK